MSRAKEEDWKFGACSESWGEFHSGARIQYVAPVDLNEDERFQLFKLQLEAHKIVNRSIARRDPDRKIAAASQRASLLGIFPEPIFVEDLPNGYCSEWCCEHLPWFRVTTKIGHIEIGWRKRVINIDWSKTIISANAETVFPAETQTSRYESSIHAWGIEAARKYIATLLAYGETP